MIDKLSKLMNQFEIGESMPLEGDLQVIQETNEPEQTTNLQKYNFEQNKEEDSDLARSFGTNNDENPFTKKSNFIAYHTTENSESYNQNVFDYPETEERKYSVTQQNKDTQNDIEEENWENEDDFTDFPAHIRNRPSAMEPNILRPLSSKHSDRYSKN